MVRALRLARGLTQKAAGELAGLSPSTVGNLECYAHRIVRRDRLSRFARALGATDADEAAILEAYDRAPLSEYAERRREQFAKQRAARKASRERPVLLAALLRVTKGLLDYEACTCAGDDACPLCDAFRILGGERCPESRDDADDAISRIELVVLAEIESTQKPAVNKPVETVNDSGSDDGADFG